MNQTDSTIDISHSEPEPCELCLGAQMIDATECCGSPFVESAEEHGYRCFRCHAFYHSRKCPECQGGDKE